MSDRYRGVGAKTRRGIIRFEKVLAFVTVAGSAISTAFQLVHDPWDEPLALIAGAGATVGWIFMYVKFWRRRWRT